MTAFDDTYTDGDFHDRIKNANEEWIDESANADPDLAVEGLQGSFMSRLLALFGIH